MTKASPTKQAFFALITSLLLSVAGTVYMLYWSGNQLDIRRMQIADKHAESLELDIKTANATGLRTQLNELSDISSISSSVLPNSKSQENIVGELILLSANRGITLDTISFGAGSGKAINPETSQATAVKEIPGIFSLSIQTSVRTDYENLLQLLEDIENNKRQFEVTDLSISPSTGEGSEGIFEVQLSLVTYIQP